MIITGEIREAIVKAIKEHGGQSALSRKSGIAQQYLCRYVNGSVKEISTKQWEKLSRFLSLDAAPKNDSFWAVEMLKKKSELYTQCILLDMNRMTTDQLCRLAGVTGDMIRESFSWNIDHLNVKIAEQEERIRQNTLLLDRIATIDQNDLPEKFTHMLQAAREEIESAQGRILEYSRMRDKLTPPNNP